MPSSHPWREECETQRIQREISYTMQPCQMIGTSFYTTETYHLLKDLEMRHYLKDFPLDKWVIKPREAKAAYRCLKKRHKLRKQGLSIFPHGAPRAKDWWPRELRKAEEKEERIAEQLARVRAMSADELVRWMFRNKMFANLRGTGVGGIY